MVERTRIDGFWKAISPLLEKVLTNPENEGLIKQIDNLVSTFGDYDWEYGPSNKTEYYFCLSPNFQEDLIDEVDEIVSFAPSLSGWEYLSCKPRKPEVFSWVMLNENDEEITVDTRKWKCVVYKFPDNTVDLDVKIDDVRGNSDTQNLAVDIHLTNVLGERNYIKIVKGVSIVSQFAEKDRLRSIPVHELFEVIAKHVPNITN